MIGLEDIHRITIGRILHVDGAGLGVVVGFDMREKRNGDFLLYPLNGEWDDFDTTGSDPVRSCHEGELDFVRDPPDLTLERDYTGMIGVFATLGQRPKGT